MSYDTWKTTPPDDDEQEWYVARCDDCGVEYRDHLENEPGDTEPRRCPRCWDIAKVSLQEAWERGGKRWSA